MARKVTQKSLKHDEFVEAAFDFEHWIEEHWKLLVSVVGGALGVFLLVWGWIWWQGRTVRETERLLAQGLSEVRADATSATAPAGDATARYAAALPAFEQAEKQGARTPAGRVATFYRGAALANIGKGAEAIAVFEPLAASAGDDFFGDVVRAKLAWAYAEAGQADKAVAAWKDLAARPAPVYPPDLALYHAGSILYAAGRTEEAKTVLQDMVARFPQGPGNSEAAKLLVKLGITPAPSDLNPAVSVTPR